MSEWLGTGATAILAVLVTAVAVYAAVILATRLGGLRSFSKMSSFDFAMTVAIGSLIASTVVAKDPPLLQGLAALAAIYALQIGVAALRRRFGWFSRAVDNQPLLLVRDGVVLHDNMRRARVTADDLRGKLREANVLRWADVRAVVMETTGDISVLHGQQTPDDDLLEGVRTGAV